MASVAKWAICTSACAAANRSPASQAPAPTARSHAPALFSCSRAPARSPRSQAPAWERGVCEAPPRSSASPRVVAAHGVCLPGRDGARPTRGAARDAALPSSPRMQRHALRWRATLRRGRDSWLVSHAPAPTPGSPTPAWGRAVCQAPPRPAPSRDPPGRRAQDLGSCPGMALLARARLTNSACKVSKTCLTSSCSSSPCRSKTSKSSVTPSPFHLNPPPRHAVAHLFGPMGTASSTTLRSPPSGRRRRKRSGWACLPWSARSLWRSGRRQGTPRPGARRVTLACT